MRWMAVALVAVLVLPAGALADSKSSKPGKVEVEGVVTTVDPQRGFAIVRGEKGRRWVVLINQATEIKFEEDDDEGFTPASVQALQVGDKVEVKGLALTDGRILALKIKVEGERPRARLQPQPIGAFIRAVVIAIANNTLVVITQNGTLTVVIQPTTRFVKGDRGVSFAALARHDVVLVRGETLGDQLLADEVAVEFDATEGVTLTGFIGLFWTQGGAFLLAGIPTWVNITSRTFIIHEGPTATLAALTPSGSVVVYGIGKGPAMQALVIVVR